MIDYLDPLKDVEQDDDEFRAIPESEWIPELEEQVKAYVAISPILPWNNIKYEHLKVPSFDSPEAHKSFWREQVRRCKEGYEGMSPKMYFFYNFCWLENITKGKIRPEYRVIDNEWFKFLEHCQNSREWGVVCVKRRRVGASWKETSDVLHDCLFNKNFHVGMNSKSERDSILLFRKLKFLFNNLPKELRIRTLASSKMFIEFATLDPETKVKKGNQSDVIVVAPVKESFEGMMLNKWVCDEAGKQEGLPDMWSLTEDCLMQETRRAGIPVIFGTSGDVGKEGKGLREMWENAEIYKLKRFFFAGWMGLAVDEYGNDRKEEAIRWIIYERKRRERSPKNLAIFMQKYPLTVEEAFRDLQNFGLGDPLKLKQQRKSLIENPVVSKRGFFKEDENGRPVFYPDKYGMCVIYEEPKIELAKKYLGGCDPADIDDVFEEASDLSTYIMTEPNGLEKPKIVFEYTDRPRELNTYYNQVILALRYYYNAKVLIERNKGGRMISYISDKGYRSLMFTSPQAMKRLIPTRGDLQVGVHMGPDTKEYGRGLGYEYVDECYDVIPSIDLIDECLEFGSKNTDKAMAFMITLMALKEVTTRKAKTSNGIIRTLKEPGFKYIRDEQGRIKRIPRLV